MGIESGSDIRPWVHWPTIAATARSNGWTVLAERRGVARMQRRDARSDVGASTLHVEFDQQGLIAGAWIDELGWRMDAHEADKLSVVLARLRESVPASSAQQ
ncbi:hypothetical protein [Mycobacteroides chelonae]|uniref:hypothetical protein n=1 Tax=Mycobacteroides chelonae TaxID=1774 RepID=UPI0010423C6A|nr:hypothetical protein [Mycobacteroides chelonae]